MSIHFKKLFKVMCMTIISISMFIGNIAGSSIIPASSVFAAEPAILYDADWINYCLEGTDHPQKILAEKTYKLNISKLNSYLEKNLESKDTDYNITVIEPKQVSPKKVSTKSDDETFRVIATLNSINNYSFSISKDISYVAILLENKATAMRILSRQIEVTYKAVLGAYTLDLSKGDITEYGMQLNNTFSFYATKQNRMKWNYTEKDYGYTVEFDVDKDDVYDLLMTVYEDEPIKCIFSLIDSGRTMNQAEYTFSYDSEMYSGFTTSIYSPFTIKFHAPANTEVTNPTVSEEVKDEAKQPEVTENIDNSLKTTSIKKIGKGKKSLTINWKKITKNVKGYQLQVSTDKDFKNNVKTFNIKKASTTSKTIKKLKAKTKYYVRIRTINKKTGAFSDWSKVKNVKTK